MTTISLTWWLIAFNQKVDYSIRPRPASLSLPPLFSEILKRLSFFLSGQPTLESRSSSTSVTRPTQAGETRFRRGSTTNFPNHIWEREVERDRKKTLQKAQPFVPRKRSSDSYGNIRFPARSSYCVWLLRFLNSRRFSADSAFFIPIGHSAVLV